MAGELKTIYERDNVESIHVALRLLEKAKEFAEFAADHSHTSYGRRASRKWLEDYQRAKGDA